MSSSSPETTQTTQSLPTEVRAEDTIHDKFENILDRKTILINRTMPTPTSALTKSQSNTKYQVGWYSWEEKFYYEGGQGGPQYRNNYYHISKVSPKSIVIERGDRHGYAPPKRFKIHNYEPFSPAVIRPLFLRLDGKYAGSRNYCLRDWVYLGEQIPTAVADDPSPYGIIACRNAD